jgi:hypothetical protein
VVPRASAQDDPEIASGSKLSRLIIFDGAATLHVKLFVLTCLLH